MDDTTASTPNRRSKWDSYDVDEELRAIDRKTIEEDAGRDIIAKEKERKEIETRTLSEARLTSGALQSHAAVTALREKESRKGNHAVPAAAYGLQQSMEDINATNMDKDEERGSLMTVSPEVQMLQSMASSSTKLYSGMEKVFMSRTNAEFALKEGQLFDATQIAMEGLTILNELLDILRGHHKRYSTDKDSHCHHRHRHCGHTEHTEPKSSPKEDEKTKLGAGQKRTISSQQEQLLLAARMDCQMIIGRAMLQQGKLANSTDFFRNILLDEPDCIDAWIERSQAFRLMGVPLLATLHSEQAARKVSAINHTPTFMKSTVEKEQQLVDEAWKAQDVAPAGEWDGGTQRLPSIALKSLCESFRRGIVLHQEQFFQSARRCFQHALGLTLEYLTKGECPFKSDLHIVEQGCRLNIAACCILQQLDLSGAIEQCSNVLTRADEGKDGEVDIQTIVRALMTRAQAYEDAGSFERAVADLESARMAVTRVGGDEVELLLKRMSAQEDHIRFVQMHYYINEPDIQTAIQELSPSVHKG